MSYTTDDFTESLNRAGIELSDIAAVLAAWGKGDGQGEDAGHYKWSDNGASDWYGGFLMQMRDGTYTYLTGWCDYTGWGCQDGAEKFIFIGKPTFQEASKKANIEAPADEEWDIEPADLNRILVTAGEAKAEESSK